MVNNELIENTIQMMVMSYSEFDMEKTMMNLVAEFFVREFIFLVWNR